MTHKIYPSYKESNVNWLGLIPDSWDITKVKFNTYVKGRVGWHGLNSDEFSDIGVHLVTGTDFDDGFVNWDSCYRITEDRYDEDPYIQLQEGDLLITKDGTIGKLARVKNLPIKATLNSGIFLVRAQDNAYLEDYLYWILRSKSFDYFLDLHKAGSTIQHLYQEVFNQFSFPIPSKREQLHLVSYLDRETDKLDTLISKQEKLIELLQEKRQAVISHAVTKGLDPDAPMKDSGVEWLGEVPEEWNACRFSRAILAIKDGTHGTFSRVDEGKLLLSAKNVNNGIIEISDDESLITIEDHESIVYNGFPKKGDLLLTIVGTIGRSCVYQLDDSISFQRSVCFIRLKKSCLPQFFYYFTQSKFYQEQLHSKSKSSAQAGVYMGDVVATSVVYPIDYKEQSAITTFLDRETTKIETLIEKAKRSIELAKEHRTALISAAVTGKIDVREYSC